MELLSSWRNSGFSVHNSVYLPPEDHRAVEALVCYMMRPPVSLARLRWVPGKDQVLHFPKTGGEDPGSTRPEKVDAMASFVGGADDDSVIQRAAASPAAAAMRRRRADMLRRVYEIDPLACPRCSAAMRAVGFIARRETIERILDHLRRPPLISRPRPPPVPTPQIPATH